MYTYAQNFEDVMLNRLFHEQATGFYIDVGAWDPNMHSVTKHFYKGGWHGVNIEPLRSKFELFERERPRDVNLNVAVGAVPGKMRFFECVEESYLSTPDPVFAAQFRARGGTVTEYMVPVVTLNEIFERHCPGPVDFLKIDIEGWEKAAIESFDWRRFRPRALVIEATKPATRPASWDDLESIAMWHDWEPIILANRYVFAYFDGLNRFYVREEDAALAGRLQLPPGVFDDIRYEEFDQIQELTRLLKESDDIRYEEFDQIQELTRLLKESELPLVTIVTPSYNQGRFIRATIESVLKQDYPRIEYLVIDGGSTDETVSILREYSDRLRWVSEPDHGQAHAINKGWRQARGSILAYLNSDDLYLPGAVAQAVAALDARPEAAAVYGEGYHVDEEGRILERYPTEPFDADRLQETCFICQPTVFLRRDAVERVGYLDASLRYCMDYDLWIRLARAGKILIHTPHYLASTRLHPDAKTLDQRGPAHVEILQVVHHHFGRLAPGLVYGHAHAVLGLQNRDPSSLDRLALIGISLVTFLRYNWSVPRSAWALWWLWLRDSVREALARR